MSGKRQLFVRLACRYEPDVAGNGGTAKRSCCEVAPLRLHVYGTHELLRPNPAVFLFSESLFGRNGAEPLEKTADGFAFDASIEWRGPASVDKVYAPIAALGGYKFSDSEVNRLFQPYKISRSARITFNGYATTYNDNEQRGMARVGSASLTLDQLFALLRGDVNQQTLPMAQSIDDIANGKQSTARQIRSIQKGWIVVSGATVADANDASFKPEGNDAVGALSALLLDAQPTFDVGTATQMEQMTDKMRAIISREMRLFFGKTATMPIASIPALSRWHNPEERLEQIFMPSLGYTLPESWLPSDPEYYIRFVRIEMQRRAVDAKTVLDASEHFFAGHLTSIGAFGFCSFGCAIITMFSSSLAYLQDFNNTNRNDRQWKDELVHSCEDNKIARTERVDDCEGLTLEALMHAWEMMRRCTFDPRRSEAEAIAARIQQMLQIYVPGFVLGAVTGAKMDYTNPSTMTKANTAAHTYGMLVPLSQLLAMLTPDDADVVRNGAFYQSAKALLEKLDADGALASLNPLICEGTASVDGVIQPIEVIYASDPAQMAVAVNLLTTKAALLIRVHQIIDDTNLETPMLVVERADRDLAQNKRSMSKFYQWKAAFQTKAFADVGFYNFALRYVGANGQNRVCVRFNDFMLASHRRVVATPIAPAVEMTPTLRITPYESALIDNLLALEEPVPCMRTGDRLPTPQASCDRKVVALIDALAVPRRREPMQGTLIHTPNIIITCRVEDLEHLEVSALQRLAKLADWASITITWRRIGVISIDHAAPHDILEMNLAF